MLNYDAQEQHIRDLFLQDMQNMESKALSPEPYFRTSVGYLSNYGRNNAKLPPYNYKLGVKKFRSWVYACASVNAKRAASVPIRLYAKKPNSGQKMLWKNRELHKDQRHFLCGKKETTPSMHVLRKSNYMSDDYVEITEHPILDLLNKVNPFMNGWEFAYSKFIDLELLGNSYYHIITDTTGTPTELWTLPAKDMTIEPSKTNFIEAYYYGQKNDEQLKLDINEVIQNKYPNPDNLWYGLGKVEAGWLVVNVNESQHNYRNHMFTNMARPDYAVIMKDLQNNQASQQRYDTMIQNLLQGSRNSGKFVTLPGNIDLKPLQFAPKDLGQDDDAIITEICSVFGTPVSKIKLNDANYSNASEGNVSWLRDTIVPMLQIDEQTINQELLPMFGVGEDAFLAYDDIVPEDQEFILKRNTQYVMNGIITANEVRISEGLETEEGGDELRFRGQSVNAPEQPEEAPVEETEEIVVVEPIKNTDLVEQTEAIEEIIEKSAEKEEKEIHVHVNNYVGVDEEDIEDMERKIVKEQEEEKQEDE